MADSGRLEKTFRTTNKWLNMMGGHGEMPCITVLRYARLILGGCSKVKDLSFSPQVGFQWHIYYFIC